jgi:adenylate cyclase class 1
MQVTDIAAETRLNVRTAETIKRRFFALNHGRFQRMQDTISATQQAFFDLLPLIFHTNDALLPGYLESDDVPRGVSDYQPGKTTLKLAARLARSFKYQRRALPHYGIQALYLMGSAGTVAHSERSDFDIWVCRDPGLSPEAQTALWDKCELLTTWGEELGLEVHFFMLTAADIRDGRIETLSHESSGSSQDLLLRDEFYRTALLLAGRYPAWWLVPPACDANYDETLAQLIRDGVVRDHEVLDFGGLATVPAEEFFGATLWQLYKAIDSPYKSVLKLQLLESYAKEYPDIRLLSALFKCAIYAGETHIANLDPYVMMMRAVERHLIHHGEPQRMELTRRCFYFKVDERLTKAPLKRGLEWRRELIDEVTREWGWNRADLLLMDSRSTWKINRVIEERSALVTELTHSYRALSGFARGQAGSASIDPAELTVLGRRLYSAFERKPGKIDLINPGISTNLGELYISIHESRSPGGKEAWALFRGNVSPREAVNLAPIKRTTGVLELIAWSYFNRLLTRDTRVALYTRESLLKERDVEAVADTLRRMFPKAVMPDRPMSDFAQSPRIVNAAVYLNMGIDPLEKFARDGRHLVSDRTDALAYGGATRNLVESVELLVVTSWQEIHTLRFQGDECLMACLSEFSKWAPTGGGCPKTPLSYCFSSLRASFIAQRINALFQDVIATFYSSGVDPARRYVVQVGKGFFLLSLIEGGRLSYEHCDSYHHLVACLGEPASSYQPVTFDRSAMPGELLPTLYQHSRSGAVQFFYHVRRSIVDIYVLDEMGTLYTHSHPFHDVVPMLSHYALFFEAVAWRNGLTVPSAEQSLLSDYMEFSEVKHTKYGFEIVRCDDQQLRRSGGYFNVQVMVVADDDGDPIFTVFIDDQEFSTLQHGDALFTEVCRYVVQRRPSGQPYPIYITDIDMSPVLLERERGSSVQTIDYLRQKDRFEQQLNQAMQQLEL